MVKCCEELHQDLAFGTTGISVSPGVKDEAQIMKPGEPVMKLGEEF